MPSEGQSITGVLFNKLPQELTLGIQNPRSCLQQPVVNVPTIMLLLPEPVVQQELVIALLGQVEASESQHNVTVVVVEVDEVGRASALVVQVILAADDGSGVHAVAAGGGEERVLEVVLVDGEYHAAEARDGLEVDGGCEAPCLAVVAGCDEAPLPHPPGAGDAVDAFEDRDAASQKERHCCEGLVTSCRIEGHRSGSGV